MKFEEYEEKLGELIKLIERENTGSPKEVAKKLAVSQRTVNRLIEKLKAKNRLVIFRRSINSYVFEN